MALALAEAGSRGDRQMVLEVITTNLAAQRVYAACGFAILRQLVGYEHVQPSPAAVDEAAHELCDVEQALPVLQAAMPAGLPWQLAPQSLAGQVSPVQALRRRDGRAAALFDAAGPAPRLLGLGVLPTAQRQGLGSALLQTLLRTYPGHWRIAAYVPDDLADAFLLAGGWQRSALAQYEMAWGG